MEQKLAPGQIFGCWTLCEPIGEGGNGHVWLANQNDGILRGAIKFLKKNHFQEKGKRWERFRHEVEFMRNENGREGLLPLLDFNCPDDPTVENRPWLVTPLAAPFSSLSLAGVAKFDELLSKLRPLAECLAALHGEGKYHRDLKPENLFEILGKPALGDFGLVDFPGKGAATETAEIMGPLFYVAPEMMQNAADLPGGPADVYAFAKTLWVLATGQKYPLAGEMRLDTPAFRISTYCPNPKAQFVDRLLDRCTRHNPNDRPTMSELSEELKALTTSQPPAAINPSDLTALAREYQGVFRQGADAQRQIDEIKKDSRNILNSFGSTFRHVEQILLNFTDIQPKEDSYPQLPAGFKSSATMNRRGPIEYAARGMHIESGQPEKYQWVKLLCFVQVEGFHDGTIRLLGGYLVTQHVGARHEQAGRSKPWTWQAKANLGTAALEAEIAGIHKVLIENIAIPLKEFGDIAKQILT